MEPDGGRGRRKPEGGFVFITAVQLCMAWWVYRSGRIQARDLRALWACWELVARRCTLRGRRDPNFTLSELHGLVGGVGGEHLRGSLRRLDQVGLVRFSASEIEFAVSPEQLRVKELESFWAMLGQVQNHARKVPVPRRMLRYLAGGAGRVTTATVLGHLLRCLYYRSRKVEPAGACKATWVGRVFDVSSRRVKAERQRLEELGWLRRVETPQWYRNRFGERVEVDLEWGRGGVPAPIVRSGLEGITKPEPLSTTGSAPPRSLSTTGSAPPESDKELSTRSKNQKPASSGPAGVSTKKLKEPNLRVVVVEDLVETERTLELFDQAVARKLAVPSENGRLQFVALAQHARRYGTRNPPGLFAELLHRQRWNFITQDDEDEAARRLKAVLYGPDDREKASALAVGDPPSLGSVLQGFLSSEQAGRG